MPKQNLTVRSPFADYKVGDTITDAAEVEAILADSRAHYVTAVSADDSASKSEPLTGNEPEE